MASKSYRDLIVWQKSMDLVDQVYVLTKGFPNEEIFGLTNQIRRSAVSIPSNISEGQGRSSKKDFERFLKIALGSAAELDTQMEIAFRQEYLKEDEFMKMNEQVQEIRKMLLD